ncbi:MAG: hypothetical protein E3K37_12715 [Candidatus Kuenenia sp.]|nr:hypothetical protein [Candidatus Kuenenia hertensis]
MKSVFVYTTFVLLLFVSFETQQTWSQDKDITEDNTSLTDNYYLKSAKKYLESADYQKAINELTLAILLEPANTEAQLLKNEAVSLLEENTVLPSTTEGVASDPAKSNDISTLIKNARTAAENDRYDDAIEILEQALTIEPGNKKALYFKEKIHEIKHKQEAAKEASVVVQENNDASGTKNEEIEIIDLSAPNNTENEPIKVADETDNSPESLSKQEEAIPLQHLDTVVRNKELLQMPYEESLEISDTLSSDKVAEEKQQTFSSIENRKSLEQKLEEIEPHNEEALYLKEKVNETKHKWNYENLKTIHSQEKLRNKEYLKEASIPYQDIVRFPDQKQWDDIANRKLPELSEAVKENKTRTEFLRTIPNPTEIQFSQKIEDALNTIISFEFIDASLQDVIAFIREKTNINMVLDANAGNVPITLKLDEVSVRTAFTYLLPKGYEYLVEGDILHIYKEKMELRVYDVRDILINLDDKEPLEFDITAATSSQLSVTKGEPVKVRDPSERVLDLIEMIVTTIEPSSWSTNVGIIGTSDTTEQRTVRTSGLGEGSITARMGQPGDLVVVNTKFIHKQIEDILASLRTAQNLQVNIEARFITVSDEFLEDIGTNIDSFFSDKISLDTGAADIIGDLGSGMDLSFAIFGSSGIKGFLKAVQESKGSEVLTSPRITLSNTQRGNIAVLQTRNYIQSTTVEDGIVTPVIGTVPEGSTFDVRPIVSADRKFVYMEVTPSVFDIEEIESFTFSGLSEDVNVGGGDGTTYIPPEQTVQLPRVNVSQVSVTVCVPDKGTLMIGGLGSLNNEDATSGVPVLSKIPVIKQLFTRDQKTRNKSNLIILLKPTIIIKEEQEKLLRLTNEKSYIPPILNTKKQ